MDRMKAKRARLRSIRAALLVISGSMRCHALIGISRIGREKEMPNEVLKEVVDLCVKQRRDHTVARFAIGRSISV